MNLVRVLIAWTALSVPLAVVFGAWLRRAAGVAQGPALPHGPVVGPRFGREAQSPQYAQRS